MNSDCSTQKKSENADKQYSGLMEQVRAKKSLGQNFLRNPHYLRLIAESAHIQEGEHILEVGPGDGVLTRELLARGGRVLAVEKDRRLIPFLKDAFAAEIASKKLMLVEGDALRNLKLPFKDGKYKLVANIPYYITGALLRKSLGKKPRPSLLVLLLQKEVAERIARSKKESLLSLSVKVYGTPRYVKTVPRGAFHPKPGVDSAILSIENISNRFGSAARERRFFELLHAGFSAKRKLLRRNLEKVLGSGAGEVLARAGIPDNARAEDVPVEKWLELNKGA